MGYDGGLPFQMRQCARQSRKELCSPAVSIARIAPTDNRICLPLRSANLGFVYLVRLPPAVKRLYLLAAGS